jgi:glycopeptide antibiotics resistance protein
VAYLRLLLTDHALILYGACLVAALVGYLCWRRGGLAALRPVCGVLLAGLVLAVLSATMLGSSTPTGRVNLVPGASMIDVFSSDYRNPLRNLLGNILLFVPIGFLAVILVGRRVWLVTAAAGALSACIELTQLALGNRWADIDDILLNTTGALLGALVGAAVLRTATTRHPAPSRSGPT